MNTLHFLKARKHSGVFLSWNKIKYLHPRRMYLLDDKRFIVVVRLLCSVSVGLADFPVLSAVELWSYLKYVQGVLFTEGIYPSFDPPYFNNLSLLSSPHNSLSLIEVQSLQWLIYNFVHILSFTSSTNIPFLGISQIFHKANPIYMFSEILVWVNGSKEHFSNEWKCLPFTHSEIILVPFWNLKNKKSYYLFPNHIV